MHDDNPIKRPDMNRPAFRRMTQERLIRLGRLKNPTEKERAVRDALAALQEFQDAWDALSAPAEKKEADDA